MTLFLLTGVFTIRSDLLYERLASYTFQLVSLTTIVCLLVPSTSHLFPSSFSLFSSDFHLSSFRLSGSLSKYSTVGNTYMHREAVGYTIVSNFNF